MSNGLHKLTLNYWADTWKICIFWQILTMDKVWNWTFVVFDGPYHKCKFQMICLWELKLNFAHHWWCLILSKKIIFAYGNSSYWTKTKCMMYERSWVKLGIIWLTNCWIIDTHPLKNWRPSPFKLSIIPT